MELVLNAVAPIDRRPPSHGIPIATSIVFNEQRVITEQSEEAYGRSTKRNTRWRCSVEVWRRMSFDHPHFHHRLLVTGLCEVLTTLD